MGEFYTELSRESVAGVHVIAHDWFTLHCCVCVCMKTVLRGFDVQLYGRPLPCIKFLTAKVTPFLLYGRPSRCIKFLTAKVTPFLLYGRPSRCIKFLTAKVTPFLHIPLFKETCRL